MTEYNIVQFPPFIFKRLFKILKAKNFSNLALTHKIKS